MSLHEIENDILVYDGNILNKHRFDQVNYVCALCENR